MLTLNVLQVNWLANLSTCSAIPNFPSPFAPPASSPTWRWTTSPWSWPSATRTGSENWSTLSEFTEGTMISLSHPCVPSGTNYNTTFFAVPTWQWQKYLLSKWAIPGLFWGLFKQFCRIKTVDSSGIRARIVRVDGEHTDHLTTTTVIISNG